MFSKCVRTGPDTVILKRISFTNNIMENTLNPLNRSKELPNCVRAAITMTKLSQDPARLETASVAGLPRLHRRRRGHQLLAPRPMPSTGASEVARSVDLICASIVDAIAGL